MWVRRGVTVWRAPPASSLPRPPRPILGRWLVPEPPPGRDRPVCDPALHGEVSSGRPARPRRRHRWFKTSFQKTGGKRARSSAAPGAGPGIISPSATRSSIYTADMSSHTEFRAQLVSLSPGSYYSISAMLAFLKNERILRRPPLPRPSQRPGSPRGGLQRIMRPVRPACACSPSPWGDVGYFRISVYGACCQARREVYNNGIITPFFIKSRLTISPK